ncbi:helix-turn-helix transcriptional regulator [Streptomyces rubiginosohelvolus]|uniref:helix-turn-helix transcriptional regulator n=1 Tax=Streptomyces rubiginosohelvolus TaxID=67362 RepID=UPI0036476AA4
MARGLADFDPQALFAYRTHRTGADGTPAPLSAQKLGDLVGASKAQILAYENGHRTPDPARIRELADHLGIRPIDLMSSQNWRSWDVADRRRAGGLTAKELSDQLGISPKSYRRLEQQGIVPARSPRFLDDVAEALGIWPAELDRAINNIAAVKARRRETASIINGLADTYIHLPGQWKGPNADDPGLARLSVLYGRPVARIRRILTKALGELRLISARREREQIIADFDPDPGRQLKAVHATERWTEVYSSELARIPARLEGFHRSAQPSNAWQALVALYEIEPRLTSWVPGPLLGHPEALEQLPPSLVVQHVIGDLHAAQLTQAGIRHVANYRDFYAALYPGLRRPRLRTARSAASAPLTSAMFSPPGSQARFAVPPHVLERLVLRSGGTGPWDLWISPSLRLSISLVSGRPTATVHEDMYPDGKPWPPDVDPVAAAAQPALLKEDMDTSAGA